MPNITDLNGVAVASITDINGVVLANIAGINGLTVSTFSGLLDDYSGAAAAYSTRRLNSAYTGAAMRVREDGTDTETDIGFDSNGDLDTAAISTHCGVNNGYVVTWYDQATAGGTGSGNDATQATTGSQPQIYNGTAVITDNGKPALQFVSDCLANSNSRNVTAYTAYVVGTYSVSGGTTRILTNSPGADYNRFVALYAVNNTTVNTYTDSNNVAAVTTSINTQLLLNFEHTGSVLTNYANGTAGTPYNDATFNFTIPGDSLGNNSGQTFSGMAQECVIYDSDQSSNRSGIEGNLNAHYQIGNFGTPTSGLLATYTGAAAAYSVRQLANTAALAMRVREDGTDTELDIGFDSNGDLDTAAIASHCGANNGYVVTWYDQSGNQVDATQGTTTSQPQIYNGAAVLTENGKPALSKNSGGSGVLSTSAISGATTISMFDVAVLGDTGNRVAQLGNVIHAGSFMYQGSILSFTSTSVAQALTSLFFNTTDEAYLNGSQVASGNAGSATAGSGVIGGQSATLRVINSMQEFVFYTSDQSSNRTGIESDINTYFSVYT